MRKALPKSRAQSSWKGWGKRTSACALVLASSLGAFSSGCAVSESDVHRWEQTERGPYKLVAVITHDKYSWQLRIDSALALIHMAPRGGRRLGISYLADKWKDDEQVEHDGALVQLSEDARKKVVDGMVAPMITEIQKPPPGKNPDGTTPPDPSIPYKDAAFAMLSHEPSLVSDPKSKEQLTAALGTWVQADFENRIENSSQQFGVEQIMRYLGAGSVKTLPSMINENSSKVDKVAALIADLGDDATKQKASEALVALAKRIDSQAWYDKEKPIVQDSDTKSGAKVTPAQLDQQVKQYQDQELTKVFGSMKRVGGRPVIDYCIAYGSDPRNKEDRRQAALAALEGRIDKNNTADVEKLFAVARDDATPDSVRDVAFQRLGELPKEVIVPKLYTLFDGKKWKVRWVAATMVLKTETAKDVPDFMRHLPNPASTKMGMSEFMSYGGIIIKMDKGKDLINGYLGAKDSTPKLVALGGYYGGSKGDLGRIAPLEDDKGAVSKCDKEDECGWSCEVPKAGSQDTESKPIATVGDFARYCIAPSLTGK